jgi:hypothetical protein
MVKPCRTSTQSYGVRQGHGTKRSALAKENKDPTQKTDKIDNVQINLPVVSAMS